VTIDYLKELSDKRSLFLASAQDPEVHGTELADGFKQIADYASGLEGRDLEKVRQELAVEFAGLFLGVWRVPAHPSESVYVTAGQLLMQKPRDDVLKVYRSMGVDKASSFAEPEDHIALELQFMTHMCEKTNTALKDGNLAYAKTCLEVQRDFLREHLGKWVPKLVADILKSARGDFYKAVAKITKGYVEMDKKVVAELMDNIVLPSRTEAPSKQ
jgi:anaerobic sulfite reductase subunit A